MRDLKKQVRKGLEVESVHTTIGEMAQRPGLWNLS